MSKCMHDHPVHEFILPSKKLRATVGTPDIFDAPCRCGESVDWEWSDTTYGDTSVYGTCEGCSAMYQAEYTLVQIEMIAEPSDDG